MSAFIPRLIVLLTLCLPLAALPLAGEANTGQDTQAAQRQTVSINQASQAELEGLPRIGPATAARIVEFRSQHNGFKTLEELMNVKGIGPKTFESLKPLIRL